MALGAFLICAITLYSAYARYEWIFLGLGLVAGRLARRPSDDCSRPHLGDGDGVGPTPGIRSRWKLLGQALPRHVAPLESPVSVIVAAHDEVDVIADKVANVLASTTRRSN